MATIVRISTPRPAPFFAPLFVAIDKGFLAEQGLEGVIQYGAGLEGIARGDVDFTAGMAAYKAFLAGKPVRQICGVSSRESSHVLMARPGIESPEQLAHILIPGGGGNEDQERRFITELTNILALHKLDLLQDEITTRSVPGSHKEQWDMLNDGLGDAATLGAPWSIIAAKAGYRSFGHESNYAPSPSGSGIYCTPKMIAEREDVVRAFVRAYVKAMRYCMTNVDGTLETLLRYSRDWGVDSLDIARAAYDEVAPYWRVQVEADVLDRAMRKLCDETGAPRVPVREFLRTEYLDEALANDQRKPEGRT
ncbi:MAG TPA: hypothetical protein VFC51_16590 [Chloroflexota bacterium]|nr:hypothetical protein [Chloroflexota bacterium]